MMVSDDKKQTDPGPKNETPPKKKSTSGADSSKAEEGGEIAATRNRFLKLIRITGTPFSRRKKSDKPDLYFQNESPGKGKEANWLPAPKEAFNLTCVIGGSHRQVEPATSR
jgi:hypothetical protein